MKAKKKKKKSWTFQTLLPVCSFKYSGPPKNVVSNYIFVQVWVNSI